MKISKKLLEDKVKRGKVERSKIIGLKGGVGTVIIYKDKRQHINPKVYESGNIILEKGTSIGWHKHINDSETYTLLKGCVLCNGTILERGQKITYGHGQEHCCINLANGESILRFVKKK